MSDYIDRDRLCNVLERNFYGMGGADVMKQLIEMQPTADVTPVKHGWWISVQGERFMGVNSWGKANYKKYSEYYCSACDARTETPTNYCPSCGARMDKGGENNDSERVKG